MNVLIKDKVFSNRHIRKNRRASKVMYLYFKYMFEMLLEKKSFKIRYFGDLSIEKTMARRNNLMPTPRYYRGDTYLTNSMMLNKRMIGEVVTVSLECKYMEKYKGRFQVCKSFRERLTDLLFNSDYGNTIPLCQ